SRLLPEFISWLPEVFVGYATALYNPCLESRSAVCNLLQSALDCCRLQKHQFEERKRELMLSMIQTPDILYPAFQAVFNLTGIRREDVMNAQASRSIKPLMDWLYGFESLLRVKGDKIAFKKMQNNLIHLDSNLLRPDVLFRMANSSGVVSELDQACLLLGIQ